MSASGIIAGVAAGSAGAAPITVGSPLQGPFTVEPFGELLTVFNVAVPETGAHVTSPVNGTVVSWHVTDAAGGPFFLVVATVKPGSSYTATALSSGGTPAGTGLQTFTTNLPIKINQIIGLNNTNASDTIGVGGSPSGGFQVLVPQLTSGATGSVSNSGAGEVAFNAVVQPLPTVTHLSRRSGTRKGGTKVTIRGTNFDGTTGVMFGSKKARRFKVISDKKITAVTPAHRAGTVRVTVLNPGKSAGSLASRFKFLKKKR